MNERNNDVQIVKMINEENNFMEVDNDKQRIEKLIISSVSTRLHGIEIKDTKELKFVSKDNKYIFIFYTIVPYTYFNELKLNQKTDIMDKIDDYDIDFKVNNSLYINSKDNSNLYLTKIRENTFKMDAEIQNLEDTLDLFQPTKKIKKVVIECIFNLN